MKKQRSALFLMIILCFMLVLSGCGQNSSSTNDVIHVDEIVTPDRGDKETDVPGDESEDLPDEGEEGLSQEDSGAVIEQVILEENQLEKDGIIYEIIDDNPGEVMVYYCQESESKVVIPSQVEDSDTGEVYTVTKISESAFCQNEDMEEVVIPDTVKVIEKEAFLYCTCIKNIEMPKKMEEIGEGAFFGCEALKEIRIPEGIEVIHTDVFSNCYVLSQVEFPSTLKEIEDESFWYCAIKDLEIPEGVEKIGSKAFYSCTELESVSFPSSLGSVKPDIFDFCENMTALYVPAGKKAEYEKTFADGIFDVVEK